jgi:uncharacterized membrane protein YkoI
MKILAKSTSLLAVFALSTGLLFAQSCPKPVKDAFKKAYPNVKAKWSTEKDKTTLHEAEFEINGVEMSATYNADGSLVETEQELTKSEVPLAVIESCMKAHPKAKMKEYAKITRASGEIAYEIEIKNNGKEQDVLFKADGVME